jgi:hypothetical protein
MKTAVYCVYEHWRSDTNVCFYVGKGTTRRAFSFIKRNKKHRLIRDELLAKQMEVDVRILFSDLDEATAFDAEITRIKHWRDAGCELSNIHKGGPLVGSGEAWNKGLIGVQIVTNETKEKIRAALKGSKRPDDVVRKISFSKKGNTANSLVAKIKMSDAAKKRWEIAREIQRQNPHLTLTEIVRPNRVYGI